MYIIWYDNTVTMWNVNYWLVWLMFKRSNDVVRLDYSGRYTYGDNDVFLSLTMPDVLPP